MTSYEAIACEILKGKVENITDEGWGIVVEALMKQVPQKPKDSYVDSSGETHWICPTCGSPYKGGCADYCLDCGQRFLWEDENNEVL